METIDTGIKNRWGESRIFETIANQDLLAARYPSPSGGLRWFVLTTYGPNAAVANFRAIAVAEDVARQGGVTGVFAINATLDGYAVAIYTTEDDALAQHRDVQAVDPAALLWWDAEYVIEMGQHALQFPMLGAWNWGKDVPPVPVPVPVAA